MENNTITTEKTFDTDVKSLYKAWTEESELKQWWKPADRALLSVDTALEEGGKIDYIFEDNDKSSLKITGEYETVKPEEQLVYTWNWHMDKSPVENGEYKLTIDFDKDGEGSKISIKQENDASEGGIHPNDEGWENALNALNQYLSSK